MLKAEDIMTKEVLTVTPETPVSIAIKILTIRHLTGLPVVDGDKTLLGIISEKDIMGVLLEDCDLNEKKVFEYMTEDVQSFGPNETVDEICEFLLHKPFRGVPLISEGKLIGIISCRDIISLIHEEKCK